MDEKQTRQQLIDEQLVRAGWTGGQRKPVEEVALRANVVRETTAEYAPTTEFADYVLLDDDGKPIAVVEAKRTSRDAVAGLRQAEDYATTIEAQFGFKPFILLTNGTDIQFIDPGRYPARKLAAFPSPEDLKRLAFQHRFGGGSTAQWVGDDVWLLGAWPPLPEGGDPVRSAAQVATERRAAFPCTDIQHVTRLVQGIDHARRVFLGRPVDTHGATLAQLRFACTPATLDNPA